LEKLKIMAEMKVTDRTEEILSLRQEMIELRKEVSELREEMLALVARVGLSTNNNSMMVVPIEPPNTDPYYP
jgi:predicted RNase H-like nuclease (RuvC/YqgF family)